MLFLRTTLTSLSKTTNCFRCYSTMEQLIKQQEQAQQTVAFLKQQLAILTQLAEQKKNASEKEEMERLVKENNILQNDITKLKQEYRFYEAQKGVKHIPLPLKVLKPTDEPIVPKPVPEPQPENKKDDKKEKKKKEKNKTESGKENTKGKQTGGEEKPVDVSRLNLIVGKIIDVKKHPDADTLFVEQVDFGFEKRTIVSGIVKHYKAEELLGRLAIFVCNLKPAKMRGILSEGMIMCASTPEKVEVIQVPDNTVIGDKIVFQGYPGEPDAQLNPKRKIWEQVCPDLRVNQDGIACYKGSPFTVAGKGPCKAPSMKDCQIK